MRDPDLAGHASAWLVHGGFHPFWTYWLVAVVHLRDLPGVKPPYRKYPEAEFELAIVSLQSPPGSEVHPDPDDLETLQPLEPADVVYQFHGATDDQARRLAELAVRTIVEGRASPDSDYRSWWLSALPRTLEHVVTGGHPT